MAFCSCGVTGAILLSISTRVSSATEMFRALASFSSRRRRMASSTAPRCALYHCSRALVKLAPPIAAISLVVIGCPSRMARGAEDGVGEGVVIGLAWKAAARTSRATVDKATSDGDAGLASAKADRISGFTVEGEPRACRPHPLLY